MMYQHIARGFVIRIEQDEEILSTLASFFEEQEIEGGYFSGIGSLKYAEIGRYDMTRFEYDFQRFD